MIESVAPVRAAQAAHRPWFSEYLRSSWFLWLAIFVMAFPVVRALAKESWSTEAGAHGPIILATGLWLLVRRREEILAIATPGKTWIVAALFVPSMLLYIFAQIVGVLGLQCLAVYGALVATLYAHVGGVATRRLWFPLLYLLFMCPPPDTVLAIITTPLKLHISKGAVDLLHAVGYPVARTGVLIYVAQYELLVAEACSGINSLISLSAIGLFYIYVRHNANWRYALLLFLTLLPIAIVTNFIRVIVLVLITYHFGDAAAQGFLHNFAGVTMFVLAVLMMFGVDALLAPLRDRLATKDHYHA
jgi:exosortase